MARNEQPEFLGVVKSTKDGESAWIRSVWVLPSGLRRVIAQKAVVVLKMGKSGQYLMQAKLVDVNGNPV